MNKDIEQLRADISQIISNSQLPIGVVYYLIKDLMNEISYLYEQQLQKENSKSDEVVE